MRNHGTKTYRFMMEAIATERFTCNLIVLSYHTFSKEPRDYQYNRTFRQFSNDLETKTFDWITIDDGHASIMEPCQIMAARNIRAKIFISTSLIGLPNYLTWDQVRELAVFHDIENHSHLHERLTWLKWTEDIEIQIVTASEMIKRHIGRWPRYFVPPFNNSDERVEAMAIKNNLQLVRDRINILNTTE